MGDETYSIDQLSDMTAHVVEASRNLMKLLVAKEKEYDEAINRMYKGNITTPDKYKLRTLMDARQEVMKLQWEIKTAGQGR